MIRIRPEQLTVLARVPREVFEHRAAMRIRETWPDQAARDPDVVRELVRRGIERAERHGIVAQRDVMRFLNLMLLLGEDFDETDPAAQEILELRACPAAQRLDRIVRDALARDDDE